MPTLPDATLINAFGVQSVGVGLKLIAGRPRGLADAAVLLDLHGKGLRR